jgi:hypothetical protein
MDNGNIFEPVIPPQQNPPLEPLRPRTLGEYSRPSHQGYRNTIELTGANVTPLRSDTIRLVQSGVHSMDFVPKIQTNILRTSSKS